MNQDSMKRFVLPAIVIIILLLTIIILGGLASANPDGFEWALFDFAGVTEPEGGFGGIWSFLGEGAAIELLTGVFGVILVLVLGYGFFKYTSRGTE